jgi:hypothetical protein
MYMWVVEIKLRTFTSTKLDGREGLDSRSGRFFPTERAASVGGVLDFVCKEGDRLYKDH